MSELHSALQHTLELLYRVEGPARIADYCVGAESVNALLGPGAADDRREALLILAGVDQTEIALYVDRLVVAEAERFVSRAELRGHRAGAGMDAFCVMLEGVSHFLYFTYCGAALERPVSQIELELQAEVDKYILLRLSFGLPELVERLFDSISLDERLMPHEHERYRIANAEARRYARWMDRKFRRGEGAAALADARALYRKPLASKLEHIARAA